jgi:VWFA-related protein
MVGALPLALLALCADGVAQFRSRTDLVEVGAVVLDRNGDPVTGLTRDDFEIVEDGRAAPISTFAAINADAPATVNDGRFVALLIEPQWPTARKLAHQIVDRMGERDVIAILSVNGSKATTTDDRQVALKQLDDLAPPVAPRRATGIAASPSDGCAECGTGQGQTMPGYPGMQIGEPMRPSGAGGSSHAATVLDRMDELTKQLKQVANRHKTLVYIGVASWLNLTERNIKNGDEGRWFEVIRDASRADVSVSVIGVGAVVSGAAAPSAAGARILAEETGGEAIVNTNVYDPGIERLWQRAGHYYLLGYTPVSEKKKRHTVDVRVKRPGVDVHALKTRG